MDVVPLLAILLLGAIGYSGRTLVGAVVRSEKIAADACVSRHVRLCSLEVNEQNIAIGPSTSGVNTRSTEASGVRNVIVGELAEDGTKLSQLLLSHPRVFVPLQLQYRVYYGCH